MHTTTTRGYEPTRYVSTGYDNVILSHIRIYLLAYHGVRENALRSMSPATQLFFFFTMAKVVNEQCCVIKQSSFRNGEAKGEQLQACASAPYLPTHVVPLISPQAHVHDWLKVAEVEVEQFLSTCRT